MTERMREDERAAVGAVTHEGLEVLIALAGRTGDQAFRERERAAREATVTSLAQARELDAEYERQRVDARRRVHRIQQSALSSRASAEDIARAWETTSAWRHDDAAIAAVHEWLIGHLRDGYGVRVDAGRASG